MLVKSQERPWVSSEWRDVRKLHIWGLKKNGYLWCHVHPNPRRHSDTLCVNDRGRKVIWYVRTEIDSFSGGLRGCQETARQSGGTTWWKQGQREIQVDSKQGPVESWTSQREMWPLLESSLALMLWHFKSTSGGQALSWLIHWVVSESLFCHQVKWEVKREITFTYGK